VTWEQESKLPALPQTCPTCGAHFKQLEADALREHQDLCASWTTRVPLSDGHGNALGMLGDPNATRLARHIQVYDRGGAEPWLHLLQRPHAEVINAVIRRRSGRRRQTRIAPWPKPQKFSEKT
jgi:hypothetical protein